MTLAELRAKLKRATPAKWDYGTSRHHECFVIGTTPEDRRYDHVAFGMTGPDASLVCAMHAALPALLDIVERVANDTTSRPNVEMCCKYCFEDEPTHATDCVWVAARALAGGE